MSEFAPGVPEWVLDIAPSSGIARGSRGRVYPPKGLARHGGQAEQAG